MYIGGSVTKAQKNGQVQGACDRNTAFPNHKSHIRHAEQLCNAHPHTPETHFSPPTYIHAQKSTTLPIPLAATQLSPSPASTVGSIRVLAGPRRKPTPWPQQTWPDHKQAAPVCTCMHGWCAPPMRRTASHPSAEPADHTTRPRLAQPGFCGPAEQTEPLLKHAGPCAHTHLASSAPGQFVRPQTNGWPP